MIVDSEAKALVSEGIILVVRARLYGSCSLFAVAFGSGPNARSVLVSHGVPQHVDAIQKSKIRLVSHVLFSVATKCIHQTQLICRPYLPCWIPIRITRLHITIQSHGSWVSTRLGEAVSATISPEQVLETMLILIASDSGPW